jgi:large subunit ribosomal protein L30
VPRGTNFPGAREERKKMAKKKEEEASGMIKLQYYRSMIGFPENQKNIVKSLGFTKLNQVVERPDNESSRGIAAKVPHLIRIIE